MTPAVKSRRQVQQQAWDNTFVISEVEYLQAATALRHELHELCGMNSTVLAARLHVSRATLRRHFETAPDPLTRRAVISALRQLITFMEGR